MVRGLDTFKAHFATYKQQYTLIGGSACDIHFSAEGIPFRSTKDIDIILLVEALTMEFVDAFWGFVILGGYQVKECSGEGNKCLYRFKDPINDEYPKMIELFARRPEVFKDRQLKHITPIAIDEDAISLSAILLDDTYYSYILDNRLIIDGLSIIKPEAILILKIKAWLDLTRRKESSEQVDTKDINKHKNDILRLTQLFAPASRFKIPQSIKDDLAGFLDKVERESISLANIGIRTRSANEILQQIEDSFVVPAEKKG